MNLDNHDSVKNEYGVEITANLGGVSFIYYINGKKIENEKTLSPVILRCLDNLLEKNIDNLFDSGKIFRINEEELLEKYQ